jgi:PIN domain nuclease of toxin-antitoxin system
MPENPLILDTCALLWLVSGNKSLSGSCREAIEKASIVYVSAISAWEISLKSAQGGIILPLEPLEWFKQSIAQHNLIIAPLDIDILIMANQLPWHHRDPADRFIIATAIRERMAVVTADQRFTAYGVKVIF